MSQAGLPRAATRRRVHSPSPAATHALAESLGRVLRAVTSQGMVLALEGDLGAGKTLFVRGLARGLGLDASVAVPSPTFALAQHFRLPDGSMLNHVDAYRLGGESELEAAGLEDICGSGRVTCVEWAGRVARALPDDRLEVELRPHAMADASTTPAGPGEGRELLFRALGPRSAALLARWSPPPSVEGAS